MRLFSPLVERAVKQFDMDVFLPDSTGFICSFDLDNPPVLVSRMGDLEAGNEHDGGDP